MIMITFFHTNHDSNVHMSNFKRTRINYKIIWRCSQILIVSHLWMHSTLDGRSSNCQWKQIIIRFRGRTASWEVVISRPSMPPMLWVAVGLVRSMLCSTLWCNSPKEQSWNSEVSKSHYSLGEPKLDQWIHRDSFAPAETVTNCL